MSFGSYLHAVAVLVLVLAPLVVAAVALRAVLVPSWSGAAARLAEMIIVSSLLTIVSELLGTIGWFRRSGLVVGAVLTMAAAVLLHRRRRSTILPATSPDVPHPNWAVTASLVASALILIQWIGRIRPSFEAGILGNDSRQYHLPLAANFAQSSRLFDLYNLWIDPVATFYPSNNELYHAVGIVIARNDALSLVINLAWLALALLAGWCIGERFGVGHLTLGVTVALTSVPAIADSQAGSAKNDLMLVAFLVAMTALLIRGERDLGSVALAAAAGGLAAGTKLLALAPIAMTTVIVLWRAGRDRRWRTGAVWVGVSLLTGGYWYLRNLVRTGNPVPEVISFLPSPEFPAIETYGRSVAGYAFDGTFWRDVVPDGLEFAFGTWWVVFLAMAAIGLALALFAVLRRRGDVRTRDAMLLLAVPAVAAGIGYATAPGSAFGPPDTPFQFGYNARYGLPALCLGMLAFVIVIASSPRAHAVACAVLAGVTVWNLRDPSIGPSMVGTSLSWVLGAAIVVLAAGVWFVARRRDRPLVLAGALVVLMGVLGAGLLAGHRAEKRYLSDRYTTFALGAWSRTVYDARIAVVGLAEQYPLFGLDLSNRVEYLGEHVAHGGLRSYSDCSSFRAAITRGGFDYVVAGTTKWLLEPAPELSWLSSDPAASDIGIAGSNMTGSARLGVFRIREGQPANPCT